MNANKTQDQILSKNVLDPLFLVQTPAAIQLQEISLRAAVVAVQ